MMPTSIPMIVLAGFPIMLTLLVPALVLVGLVGRPRPTRPRCRACRRALGEVAILPAACPGCAASLEGRGAVRFGGYRLRPRPLVWGVVLGALIGLPMVLSRVYGRTGTTVVNGVVIESGVTAERFEQATAAGDGAAWAWVNAHLQAEALDDSLRARAAKSFVEAMRAGSSDRVLMQAFPKLVDVVDGAALGEALLDTMPPPRVFVGARTPTETAVEVDWKPGVAMTVQIDNSFVVVMAITEVRVDGTEVRPRYPHGRFFANAGYARLRLPAEGLAEGDPLPKVEVDTVTAVVRDPPSWLRSGELPGPPESWPGVQAMRRSTLVAGEP